MSSTLAWGIALAVATVFATPSAQAVCYGSSNMYTCSDSSGNSYNVNRFGTTTTVNGYNAQTGSSWSQTSSTTATQLTRKAKPRMAIAGTAPRRVMGTGIPTPTGPTLMAGASTGSVGHMVVTSSNSHSAI